MNVLDASAMIEVLLQTPAGRLLAERLLLGGETVHAPHLIDLEVAQVLRRYCREGEIDAERARQALTDLAEFPLERYSHEGLLARVWQLRDNLTAYDAAYVTLAEAIDATLVTADRRIAAAPGHSARVELI